MEKKSPIWGMRKEAILKWVGRTTGLFFSRAICQDMTKSLEVLVPFNPTILHLEINNKFKRIKRYVQMLLGVYVSIILNYENDETT